MTYLTGLWTTFELWGISMTSYWPTEIILLMTIKLPTIVVNYRGCWEMIKSNWLCPLSLIIIKLAANQPPYESQCVGLQWCGCNIISRAGLCTTANVLCGVMSYFAQEMPLALLTPSACTGTPGRWSQPGFFHVGGITLASSLISVITNFLYRNVLMHCRLPKITNCCFFPKGAWIFPFLFLWTMCACVGWCHSNLNCSIMLKYLGQWSRIDLQAIADSRLFIQLTFAVWEYIILITPWQW